MLPGRHAQAVQDVLGLRRWGHEERVVDVWPELAHGSSSSGMTVYLTLGGEDLGHVLVGDDPVVHVIAQGIHVEVVAVADLHPDAQRLGGAVGLPSGAMPRGKRVGSFEQTSDAADGVAPPWGKSHSHSFSVASLCRDVICDTGTP